MSVGDDLSILIPAYLRPHRVEPLMDSIRAATPGAQVLYLCDPEDKETCEAALRRVDCDFIASGGNYAEKINLGVRLTQRPLVFFGADDLHFHKGWLDKAKAQLRGRIHVAGVNDLCSGRVQKGRHATHFLVTRSYATANLWDGKPGPLCTEYDHSCVDDEFVLTCRNRRVIVFATDAIVEHLHPDAGKADWDATYAKGRAYIRADHRLLRARRQKFG